MSGRAARSRRQPEYQSQAASQVAGDHQAHELWVTLAARPWRALALVPAGPTLSGRSLARSLLDAARFQGETAVCLIDGAGASAADGARLAGDVEEVLAQGGRVLLPVDALTAAGGCLRLLLAADAALLLVQLGVSSDRECRQALAAGGERRFLGCVVVPPPSGRPA